MKASIPILICDENEDFRTLLREMLTKHGFFHVLEVVNEEEMKSFLPIIKDHLVIIQAPLLNQETLSALHQSERFIILAQPQDQRTSLLAVQLGVKHFLSFPFSSRILLEKIEQLN